MNHDDPFEFEFDGVKYFYSNNQEFNSSLSNTLLVQQPYNNIDFWNLRPAKSGDIGYDLPVRIKHTEHLEMGVKVQPHKDYYINYNEGWVDVPTNGYCVLPSGIHVKIPDDAWGLIAPRSSTSWQKHLNVFLGIIDSGYTGQLCCLIQNPHQEAVRIEDGMRLTQLILIPKYQLKNVIFTNFLPDTDRSEDGFGSTGGQ